MNVTKNINVQNNSYDKLERLWGFSRQSTGLYNKNKISSDMQYVG